MTGPRPERTVLTPFEEWRFREWAKANNVTDVDHPELRYDYRGYWKSTAAKGQDTRKDYPDGPHFPDTYKQHGHPTFSEESQYSTGPGDGGTWIGERFQSSGAPLRQPQPLKPLSLLAMRFGLKP